jgi:hypothetical protein
MGRTLTVAVTNPSPGLAGGGASAWRWTLPFHLYSMILIDFISEKIASIRLMSKQMPGARVVSFLLREWP